MTRVYLSPAATLFAKIGLLFVEFIIGLFNVISFPVRKITFKAYCCITLIFGALYAATFYSELEDRLVSLIAVIAIFTASILITKITHYLLKKKVSPKVAYLLNSPLGIPLNRFHKIESRA